MASFINTNISSINAQNNLTKSSMSLTTALQRLSSGLRINSAKDDAAGLAISQRMAAQIGGLTQAARNANDAISLAQTAEGALSSTGDNLQRLRTLAVQAANSTNSDSDRAAIQSEVASLVSEINRVATTTQFNGINLLDGSFTAQNFQVGANANQTISVSVGGATTDKLGSTQASSITAFNNGTSMSGADMTINGIAVGASLAASDSASSANGAASAIAKAAAVNAVSNLTGVSAKADQNVVAGTAMTLGSASGTFEINGIFTATITTGGVNAAADRSAVIAGINAISGQTGVVAVDGGSSAAGVSLVAADGRNISVSINTLTAAQAGVTASGASVYGTYTLSSVNNIVVSGNYSTLQNGGVYAGSYATQTAIAQTRVGTATAFATGDFAINGVLVGASLAASDSSSSANNASSAIAKVAAINKLSSQTGVSATVLANTVAGSAMTPAALTDSIEINGIFTAAIATTTDASASRAAVITAVNAISGKTGVIAVDGGSSANGVLLVATDGRNISTSLNTLTTAASGLGAGGATYGNFSLSSSKVFTVASGTTGAVMSTVGMANFGTYGNGKTGQSLSTIDVSTALGANAAIVAIDNAISSVNSTRANLGAIQNRFVSTISTLQSSTENLTAAKSRIVDADFAAETANLTRGQILQQAGTAMLAQANAIPNGILALLR